jgi:hypothetical protein
MCSVLFSDQKPSIGGKRSDRKIARLIGCFSTYSVETSEKFFGIQMDSSVFLYGLCETRKTNAGNRNPFSLPSLLPFPFPQASFAYSLHILLARQFTTLLIHCSSTLFSLDSSVYSLTSVIKSETTAYLLFLVSKLDNHLPETSYESASRFCRPRNPELSDVRLATFQYCVTDTVCFMVQSSLDEPLNLHMLVAIANQINQKSRHSS